MDRIKKPRWGLPGGHPPTKNPPLDEECLAFAIDILGNLSGDNREGVTERIRFIALRHRHLRSLDENPIRPADLKNNLHCVENSAKTLRRHIAALDFESLRRLRQHGMFKHGSLIEPISDSQRRGDEFDAICENRDSRLLSMLDLIVTVSEGAIAELSADKGGGKKQSILGGTADEELVASCHSLFQLHRPGKASTTTGGDFRTFVSLVYYISTGKAHVDLERPIKKHIRNSKRDRNTP
jgi:hypothetical protein